MVYYVFVNIFIFVWCCGTVVVVAAVSIFVFVFIYLGSLGRLGSKRPLWANLTASLGILAEKNKKQQKMEKTQKCLPGPSMQTI